MIDPAKKPFAFETDDAARRSPRRLLRAALAATRPRPDDQIDPLGMPVRLHYYLFSMFSFVMSAGPLAISFTPAGAAFANWVVRGMCITGLLVLTPVYYLWGKRNQWRRDPIFYHFGATSANLSMAVGAAYNVQLRGPMIAAVMVVPVAAGYYLSIRQGLPHVIAAVAIVIYAGMYAGEPEQALHAAMGALVIVSGWSMIALTKGRLVAVLDTHRRLSETDPLTGAFNVRRLQKLLEDEIARSNRNGDGFALIEFDLDDFKQCNDRYSLSMGDATLVATVKAVSAELTPADSLIRRGGDEFSVVAPAIAGRDPEELCRRIAATVAIERGRLCPDVRPSASIAFAQHADAETAHELIKRVDQRLHDAKVSSRTSRRVADNGGNADVDAPPSLSERRAVQDAPAAKIDAVHTEQIDDPIVVATAFAWRQAGVLFVVTIAVMIALMLTHRTAIELTPMRMVLSGVCVLLAPVCWWMSNRRTEARLMTHLIAIGSLIVISAMLLSSGKPAVAAVEAFLIAILFQVYLLPTRAAMTYAAATMVLVGAFLIGYGYPQTGVRFSTDLNNIALVAVVLTFARRRTIEMALDNARLARIDALTGLSNVRELRDRIEKAIARGESGGGGFAIVMLDLDDFKRVNDMFDHTHGDEVLVAVADAIKSNARLGELPARRGGDEFAVILNDADDRDAHNAIARFGAVTERVRREVDPEITPTASFGYASWREGESVDDLLRRVDLELHHSKQFSHESRRAAGLPVRGERLHSA